MLIVEFLKKSLAELSPSCKISWLQLLVNLNFVHKCLSGRVANSPLLRQVPQAHRIIIPDNLGGHINIRLSSDGH